MCKSCGKVNTPNPVAERIRREAEENDAIYRYRPSRPDIASLHYGHVWALSWAFEQLGPQLKGRKILDIGIGEGHSSVALAQQGAEVTGIEVSDEALARASQLAGHLGVRVELHKMPGEYLDFHDRSFDGILCMSAFHHMDLGTASQEFARVLKPGGRAVFFEPLFSNPPAWLYRRLVRWRWRGATSDEKPLRIRDLDNLRRYFTTVEWRGMFLLTLAPAAVDRIWDNKNPLVHRITAAMFNRLIGVDEVLLRSQWLGRLAWKIGIVAAR